jgi:hypothetical protein
MNVRFFRGPQKQETSASPEFAKADEGRESIEVATPKAAEGPPQIEDFKSSPRGVTLRIPSWFLRGLGALVVLALIGLGVWYFALLDTGPSEAEKRAEAARNQQALDAAARAQCQSQTGALVSAEADLEGRLSGAGLTESDYLTRVGNISAAYGQVPVKQESASCVTKVGVPAEAAMNAYVSAANTWNDCMTDFNCSQDSIDPQLQAQWTKASIQLQRAKSGLNQVQSP